jgi:hypothetical protein
VCGGKEEEEAETYSFLIIWYLLTTDVIYIFKTKKFASLLQNDM